MAINNTHDEVESTRSPSIVDQANTCALTTKRSIINSRQGTEEYMGFKFMGNIMRLNRNRCRMNLLMEIRQREHQWQSQNRTK